MPASSRSLVLALIALAIAAFSAPAPAPTAQAATSRVSAAAPAMTQPTASVAAATTALDAPAPITSTAALQLVSPFAGALLRTAAISGSMAYIGQANALALVDFADIDTPELRATLPISSPQSIQVVGSAIFVASSASGLQIIDAANPNQPALAAAVPTSTPVRALAVAGSNAYLGLDDSLEVVDVSNLARLSARSTLPMPGPVQAIQLVGTRAIVSHRSSSASDSQRQISVVAVDDSANLRLLARYNANDAALVGDLLYLATEQGLQIADLARPLDTQLRGRLGTSGPLNHIQVVGSLAYVAGQSLLIIDVADPDAPQLRGSLSGTFASLHVAGDLAYVTIAGDSPPRNELTVIDLADTTAPWRYQRPTIAAPLSDELPGGGIISISGTLAFMLAYRDGRGELVAVDLSDPATPRPRGHFSNGIPAPYQLRTAFFSSGGSPRPAGLRNPFGVQLEGLNDARGLREAQTLGTSWVRRGPVSWRAVQPSLGNPYDWSALSSWEQEFSNAAAAGLTPVVMVGHSPRWATNIASDCSAIAPEHYQDFARFMAALVTRYSQPPYNIMYYELGNEPDIDSSLVSPDSGFGCWGVIRDRKFYGGLAYGAMLRVVYPAIKAANPRAQVLIGGLLLNAPLGNNAQGYPERFLRGILEAQKDDPAPSFDIVSFHGYGYHFSTSSSPFDAFGGFVLGKAAFIRQELATYGRDAQLLNTETAVLCIKLTDDCRQRQADYMPRIYAETLAGGLLGSIWYLMDTDEFYNTGLVDQSTREPRLHYFAYQAAIKQLRAAHYLGTLANQNSGVTAYRFSRGDQTLLVAWSDSNASLRTPIPTGATPVCKNRDGVTITCTLDNDTIAMPLSRSPIYIIFVQ